MEIDVKAVPDEAWADFFASVLAENHRRNTIIEGRRRVEAAASEYAQAVQESAAKEIKSLDDTAVCGPGEKIIVNGEMFENVSGAWLSPFTAGPDTYPLGWKRAGDSAVKPDDLPEWKADTAYKSGDKASYEGAAYECLQGHKSQPGWEPPAVAALWKLA